VRVLFRTDEPQFGDDQSDLLAEFPPQPGLERFAQVDKPAGDGKEAFGRLVRPADEECPAGGIEQERPGGDGRVEEEGEPTVATKWVGTDIGTDFPAARAVTEPVDREQGNSSRTGFPL